MVRKIEVSGDGGGLQNPFAALDAAGLPPGTDAPLPVTPPVASSATRPAQKGRVVLRRETAHRGGKTVVVVGDIPLTVTGAEIDELARRLRKHCGCGGTVRGREIEIQGDQPAKVTTLLEELGFRVAGTRG
jgi:translation initiation factor 1